MCERGAIHEFESKLQRGTLSVVSDGYEEGALIAGKYRVKRRLGRGGMGSVYKAENTAIARTVAVKVLRPYLADNATTLSRFQREAKATAAVGHPHVVETLDMGFDGSAPYIVMEYIRGRSLAQVIHCEGAASGIPLAIERCVRIAGQILEALIAVHGSGIVHRDLKPDNVLLTTRAEEPDYVKLLDFGVAAFVEDARDAKNELTPIGRAMGTPLYASPEQIRGDAISPAMDLYAVGVILFEMLTKRRPFDADNFADLARAILEDEVPPLEVFRRDVPMGIETVVRRALSKDPVERFPDAGAMLQPLTLYGACPAVMMEDPTSTFVFDLRELQTREREQQQQDVVKRSQGASKPLPDRVRGWVVRQLLGSLEERLGLEPLQALREELFVATGLNMDEAYEDDDWVPGGTLVALFERADARHGKGDRQWVAEAGRGFARSVLEKVGVPATPELLFIDLPSLWKRCFESSYVHLSKVGRGYGRFEVRNDPRPALGRSVAVVGFVEEALRRTGARDVEVRVLESVALGDALDAIVATWSD